MKSKFFLLLIAIALAGCSTADAQNAPASEAPIGEAEALDAYASIDPRDIAYRNLSSELIFNPADEAYVYENCQYAAFVHIDSIDGGPAHSRVSGEGRFPTPTGSSRSCRRSRAILNRDSMNMKEWAGSFLTKNP